MRKRFRSIRVVAPALAFSLVAALGAPLPTGAVEPTDALVAVPVTGLNGPQDIGVAKDGTVYVADAANNRIVELDTDGNQSVFMAATGATHTFALSSPSGVDVDFFGVIYIADTGNNQILKFDPKTNSTTVLVASGVLSAPSDVAVAGSGTVYVSDTGNNVVRSYSANGVTTNIVIDATNLASPGGIAVDKLGTVYVADTGNHRVMSLTTAGVLTRIVGNATSTAGVAEISEPNNNTANLHALSSPSSVAVDKGLNVYVADTGNNRIRKVTPGGFIVEMASPAGVSGVGTQVVTSAQGIATDKHGSVFIATGNEIKEIHQPDLNPPEIVVNLTDGSKHTQNKSLKFVFSCSDFYSGIDETDPAACVGTKAGAPITSGSAIDTSAKGAIALSVTATDREGNSLTVNSQIHIVDKRVVIGEYANSGGNIAAVARLYIAIMKRQPEAEGHAFWLGEVDAGRRTLREAASFFISKEEFQSLYGGDTTDFEYIDLLYGNIMGRDASLDPEGQAFWRNALTVTHTHDRTAVALFFSQSQEILGITQTS